MNRQQRFVPQAQPQAPKAANTPKPLKLPVFEVTKIVPVETGTLVCFADVLIGRGPTAIEICKFRLIQQPAQRPWLSAPQETWIDSDTGERRYTNIVKVPKVWNAAITQTVITAWEKHKLAQNEETREAGN